MWSDIIQPFTNRHACRLCHAPTGGGYLCSDCERRLPRTAHACSQCGLPLTDHRAIRCGECLRDPPAFDAAVIPLLYAPPVAGLIGRLKRAGGLPLAPLLAAQLASRARGRRIDLLIPVPLHRRRLRERGFNQCSELCRELSRQLEVPWDAMGLNRVRPGSPQRESRRRDRLRNVRNAFQWNEKRPCPPRVALVDDVVTTGATMRAAAASLKAAGAEWVEIWAVARTPVERP